LYIFLINSLLWLIFIKKFKNYFISIIKSEKAPFLNKKSFGQNFVFLAHSVKFNPAKFIICSILKHYGSKLCLKIWSLECPQLIKKIDQICIFRLKLLFDLSTVQFFVMLSISNRQNVNVPNAIAPSFIIRKFKIILFIWQV
jgi:hypothetical protein